MRKIRKSNPRKKNKKPPNPNAANALKEKWRDPEFRARMLKRKTGRKIGQPDGVPATEAERLWDEARKKADYLMAEIEKEGIVEFSANVPEDQMAKTALREAFVIAMSPMQTTVRLAALKMVLEYTKAKPATKTDLTLASAEAWLKAVVEDHDKGE